MKNATMMTCILFMLMYKRIGIINRVMLGLITCECIIFLNKTHFYKMIVEDVAQDMTLAGQEARIQLRYHFPEMDRVKGLKEMGEEYK